MTNDSRLEYVVVQADKAGTLTVLDNPIRMTFPDGGTLDLAVGQTIEVEVVETAPATPKTGGWSWIEDAIQRGNEAADRREGIQGRVKDRGGDTWLHLNDGTYCPDGWGGGRSDKWDATDLFYTYGPLTPVVSL